MRPPFRRALALLVLGMLAGAGIWGGAALTGAVPAAVLTASAAAPCTMTLDGTNWYFDPCVDPNALPADVVQALAQVDQERACAGISPSPVQSATPKPSPTGSPSPCPSPTVHPSPTGSPSPTSSPSPSPSPSHTPTPSPTSSPSPSPSSSPCPSPSSAGASLVQSAIATPVPSSSPTPTRSPSPTSSPSPSPTPSHTPTSSPSPSPSPTSKPSPTSSPSPSPSSKPSPSPSPSSKPCPSPTPTPTPTATPTPTPTPTDCPGDGSITLTPEEQAAVDDAAKDFFPPPSGRDPNAIPCDQRIVLTATGDSVTSAHFQFGFGAMCQNTAADQRNLVGNAGMFSYAGQYYNLDPNVIKYYNFARTGFGTTEMLTAAPRRPTPAATPGRASPHRSAWRPP